MNLKPILVAALAVAGTGACAADLAGDCKPVFAAMEKTILTDHTMSIVRNGVTSQGVTAGGAIYVQYKGAWHKSPISAQDMIAQEHENLRNAKAYRCQRVGDSTVDGVPVAIYRTHTETDSATDDGTVAISREGVAVQVVGDMKGDANLHFVAHYGYGNVKPPM